MIILSIDVGIKNLAYCIIKLNKSNCNDKNSIEIIDWNIVNLCETLNLDLDYVKSCKGLLPATRFAVDAYVNFVENKNP